MTVLTPACVVFLTVFQSLGGEPLEALWGPSDPALSTADSSCGLSSAGEARRWWCSQGVVLHELPTAGHPPLLFSEPPPPTLPPPPFSLRVPGVSIVLGSLLLKEI